jgi:oligopeptide/dipeptide ABC transporter ATP-binding protein
MSEALLELRDLHVEFATYGGTVQAVRGASYAVRAGSTLAVVGESGCGKSVAAQAMMGLIEMPPGRITAGSARFMGQELLGMRRRELNRLRGARIGMVFQDPMSALNPTMRIGEQIAEPLIVHQRMGRRQAWLAGVELLERSGIAEPGRRARQYPFEFSGGMLQRAMIAMSIACKPALLIADEPTTALDVTVQSQILELLRELQREQGMAMVLITHDLGVVARMADDVAVMYAGRVVESAPVDAIFHQPAHPYTRGLLDAMPRDEATPRRPLRAIEGSPPDLFAPPAGCAFAARCPHAMRVCATHEPPAMAVAPGQYSRCWLQHSAAPQPATADSS